MIARPRGRPGPPVLQKTAPPAPARFVRPGAPWAEPRKPALSRNRADRPARSTLEGTAVQNVRTSLTPRREEKIRRVLAMRQKGLTLVLSNIHDPHNVSAIYRSCDAFGVAEVHLHYTDTAFPVLGAKSSASARKWVNTVRHADARELAACLSARGIAMYATSCSPKARPVHDLDLTRPVAFVLGNEHRGVEAELAELSAGEVYIPMYGMIQSFNVSVAAAVLLAEAARQRRLAGMYDSPTHSDAELDDMYAAWSKK